MPEEHRLQAVLAAIFDDGSIKSWELCVFKDWHEPVVNGVRALWESLFQGTSRVYTFLTPKGTRVFELRANRDGILQLWEKVQDAVKTYGPLAGLWEKETELAERVSRAQTRRAMTLCRTRENAGAWREAICNYAAERPSFSREEVSRLLGVSRYGAYRQLRRLRIEGRIFTIRAGNRARYSAIYEDTRDSARFQRIAGLASEQGRVCNRDVRLLFGLGEARAYVLLKRMVGRGLLSEVGGSPRYRKYVSPTSVAAQCPA
jgi:hypothetical protein